ncbi:MAG: hypothetical protein ACOCR1_04700 [Planctomycetota bacterium]
MHHIKNLTVYTCLTLLLLAFIGTGMAEEESITRVSVPRTNNELSLEGRINDDTWAEAATLPALSRLTSPDFAESQVRRWLPTRPDKGTRADRSVSFWLKWDAQHLYVAARSPVPEDAPPIMDLAPDRTDGQVIIHDDVYELAVSAPGNNGNPDTNIYWINARGHVQSRTAPPDYKPYGRIGRTRETPEVQSEIWEDEAGRKWWDLQMALSIDELGASSDLEAGQVVRISMARIFQDPWEYVCVPVTERYMDSGGFARAVLSEDDPTVRIEEARIDERADFDMRILNPNNNSSRDISINLDSGAKDAEEQQVVEKTLEPASSTTADIQSSLNSDPASLRGDVEADSDSSSLFHYPIPPASGNEPPFLRHVFTRSALPLDYVEFNGGTETLTLQSDAVLSQLSDPDLASQLKYQIIRAEDGTDSKPVMEGVTDENDEDDHLFTASVDLSELDPDQYHVRGALLDDDGNILVERTKKGFRKSGADSDRNEYLWYMDVQSNADNLAGLPPLRDLPEVTDSVNEWFEEGTAAGNIGDYYHNHDGLHAYLRLHHFPQLTPIDATDARRSLKSAGLQKDKLFTGRVIGNASIAGRFSLPETAYRNGRDVRKLYQQYRSNHLYCYVSFKTGADDYTARTPYVVISRGASGSEQEHLKALFATLAAFRPETKELLTENDLIAPTLQMLLRKNYGRSDKDTSDYLSARSHPIIFNKDDLNPEGMVRDAHAMAPEEIPPLVKIRVDDESVAGGAKLKQRFTTPSAISRVISGDPEEYTAVLSAEDSIDVGDEDLRWEWKILAGDKDRTVLEPAEEDGSRTRLEIEPQPGRVDIAAFAHNGKNWSAPAFLSVIFQTE